MNKTITIEAHSIMEVEKKAEILKWLADNATTQELEKIKKLAQNPQMRAMLKTV